MTISPFLSLAPASLAVRDIRGGADIGYAQVVRIMDLPPAALGCLIFILVMTVTILAIRLDGIRDV